LGATPTTTTRTSWYRFVTSSGQSLSRPHTHCKGTPVEIENSDDVVETAFLKQVETNLNLDWYECYQATKRKEGPLANKVDAATLWLTEILAANEPNPTSSADIKSKALANDIGLRTLRRAQTELQVIIDRSDGRNKSAWVHLPPDHPSVKEGHVYPPEEKK
jgi:hypothetical protein